MSIEEAINNLAEAINNLAQATATGSTTNVETPASPEPKKKAPAKKTEKKTPAETDEGASSDQEGEEKAENPPPQKKGSKSPAKSKAKAKEADKGESFDLDDEDDNAKVRELFDALRKEMMRIIKIGKRDDAIAVLDLFGVERISAIQPDDMPEALEQLQGIQGDD